MTTQLSIQVSVKAQRLALYQGTRLLSEYPVSTAANGVGCQQGSEQTPSGRHIVRACIGADAPMHSVFVGRRATGEIYSAQLAAAYPQRDWILSRILWLSGCEPGHNRLGPVDTMRRYIYIHGTNEESLLGQPVSHGCIRMANAAIIDLFARVTPGIAVVIAADA